MLWCHGCVRFVCRCRRRIVGDFCRLRLGFYVFLVKLDLLKCLLVIELLMVRVEESDPHLHPPQQYDQVYLVKTQ